MISGVNPSRKMTAASVVGKRWVGEGEGEGGGWGGEAEG